MTELAKGANLGLPPAAGRVRIDLAWTGDGDPAVLLLLLDPTGRVHGDGGMIGVAHPVSADGAVRYLGRAPATGPTPAADGFVVDLGALSTDVLTVGVAVTGGRVVGAVLTVVDEATNAVLARYGAAATAGETALLVGELYRRAASWKVRAVGQGWAGGWSALAAEYGIAAAPPTPVQVAPPAAPPEFQPPAPPQFQPAVPPSVALTKAVRLDKQLQGQPAQLIDLVKRAGVSLEKRGLGAHRARVALCLDISASMSALYRSGKVQQLCERVLALAVQFDDDGQCDVFTFGRAAYVEEPLDLSNHRGYVQDLIGRRPLEGGTFYGRAMAEIRRYYFPESQGQRRDRPRPDALPVYVMFVTDGAPMDKNDARQQITWASLEPTFWQFMAIGHSSKGVGTTKKGGLFQRLLAAQGASQFSFLEELDEMPGRYIDNANFFSVADPAQISDEQLFEQMMGEYPQWLALARQGGLLPPNG